MPKNNQTNSKGGKKHKRFKKQRKGADEVARSYYITKNEDTEYGIITKVLGDKRFLCKLKSFEIKLHDKEILVRVPKKFKRKRWWVSVGDYVLVGMREYQADRGDIIYLYDNKEVRRLIKEGELPRLLIDGEVEKLDSFVFDDYEDEELSGKLTEKEIPPQPKRDFELKSIDDFDFDDI